jgi:putative mRNA 3-end processing factor
LGAVVTSNSGIRVDYRGKRFSLDPHAPASADFTFVSHAHIDHMHNPSAAERILASEPTKELASVRGYELGELADLPEGVELLDSGHILGSRAFRLEDEVYYTGDASGRDRAFLGVCKTKHARVLIMETTYGSPEYVFPQTAKLVKEVNSAIGEAYHRGRPVILMGYPLGKAQLLAYFFSTWEPLYYHVSVAKMNRVHREHGVKLKTGRTFDPEEDLDSLPAGPWVMVAPLSGSKNQVTAYLRKKYGAMTFAFSGWATGGGYGRMMGADRAFPLSDHCDYPELMELVKKVGPEVVYTTHGFAAGFAADLRREGFEARTIIPNQSSLADYAESGRTPD